MNKLTVNDTTVRRNKLVTNMLKQVNNKNTKKQRKNKGKTKSMWKKPRYGRANDEMCDFKSRMTKKNHPSSLTNKGLKEITEGKTIRFIEIINNFHLLLFLTLFKKDFQ